jgi:hypothetical protein
MDIASVTADSAFDTYKSHDTVAERSVHALIPLRKNAKPWKTATTPTVGYRNSKPVFENINPDLDR